MQKSSYIEPFSFSVLTERPCNWSGKHALDSQPIIFKIKTNQDLSTRVFSCFADLTVFCCCFVVVTVFFLFHFDFSITLSAIFVCSDYPLRSPFPLSLIWIWFYNYPSKIATRRYMTALYELTLFYLYVRTKRKH